MIELRLWNGGALEPMASSPKAGGVDYGNRAVDEDGRSGKRAGVVLGTLTSVTTNAIYEAHRHRQMNA